ncbi:amidinotransferase [Marinomonas pontica]|uniref:Amidinotransferase n=1 Tax=Marinomonas pontica TaxID=264739 RepID=A0ABM8FFV9_9GAMM|nr:amidinotransferase [Marinomonas pontica]
MLLQSHSQAPNTVVLIRPHHFVSNPQTMEDNAFQKATSHPTPSTQAYQEVTNLHQALQQQGVSVHLFEDETAHTPDSVFPNNWFSTHKGNTLVAYPMYAHNRQMEYRQDIIDFLSNAYAFHNHIDLRHHVDQRLALEGTGSIVFDHIHRLAYAAQSKRTDEQLLNQLCQQIGYAPIMFDARDKNGKPIYHTNVLMCVATHFVMIGMDMVNAADKAKLYRHFSQTGKKVIELSHDQIGQFCGNAIELQGTNQRFLALSQTAYAALNSDQKTTIESFVTLVPCAIPTIESAGGSVRCMIAGIHRE